MLIVMLLDLAALAAAVGIFLGPLSMSRDVRRKGEVMSHHNAAPIIAGMLNCFIVCCYAVVLGNFFPLFVTNAVGLVLNASYLWTFFRFAKPGSRAMAALRRDGIIAICIGAAVLLWSGRSRWRLGSALCGITVFQFFSPLTKLVSVLRTRSSKFLPFGVIAANTVCSLLWAAVGIRDDDIYIYGPNVAGSPCLLQLWLYFHFRGGGGGSEKKKELPVVNPFVSEVPDR